MRLAIAVAMLLMPLVVFAFPLRGVEQNAKVDMKKLSFEQPAQKDGRLKILFIFDSEKRLSIKQFAKFDLFCARKDVKCLALDKSDRFAGTENVAPAKDPQKYTDSWRIIALPVTVFIDKDDKIREAVGYEGDYGNKVADIVASLVK
jgi:hypothetical protein